MIPNPYAPPESRASPPASNVRLFGATAILLHAILLSPAAGALMAAVNYRRLGDAAGFRRALALYVVPSVALLFFSIAAAANRGRVLLVFGAQILLAYALFREQRPLVERHVAAGGRRARWYLATLVALLVLMVGLVVWQVLDPGIRPASA